MPPPAIIELAQAESRSIIRHVYAAPAEPYAPPPAAFGGRLVSHPAWNIACNRRDAGTRALPCDQPVWVYGHPCEIGIGGGRYVNCD
jgi:hypothetical protein